MTRHYPPNDDTKRARQHHETFLKNYSLIDIIDINHLQELQDSFAKAHRIASSIVDITGSPITKPSNYCEVCQIIRGTEKGLLNCMRSGKVLGEMSLRTQKPYCHSCESIGFLDAAAPIVIENVHVANWLIGQNSIGSVNEERIISYAEEIGVDSERMLRAFHKMGKMSEEHFREKLDFLWLMANRLSNQAYQQLRYQTMLRSLEKSQKELNEYKNNLEQIVNQRTNELEEAIQRIRQISIRDALTGCFNRGGINEYLPKEMKRARRYNNPIAILIFDLDHFKRINDNYGHQSGDLVLKQVVETIQQLIRQDVDWLGRFGGEEFILIMPLTDTEGAVEIAERLREAVAEIPFLFSGEAVHVTASFGVSSIEEWQTAEDVSHETLLNSADVYLYQAKSNGRNLVVAGPPGVN
ncbi:diguanylate cyclase [Desulfopila aestuarii]|uniref:diguanylate cyclase n=1 Tax=Desulfopila aestuarii DSM 18488 TaxID=1121416 RepID=A0A1M7Y913_9BACT|nr:diguanylate cyclase [Desulfopila aestuarii]SHO49046.1 diguanylate cyclase (GGDEF) domain-containing protein [Desulfopila aestuarii DSM 18488]